MVYVREDWHHCSVHNVNALYLSCATLLNKSRDRVTPALRELHWLPVAERIQYKLCLLVHKSLLGTHAGIYLRPSDIGCQYSRSIYNARFIVWQPHRAADASTNWRQSLFCCCTASVERAADGAETVAIEELVSSWSENISVSFCLRAPRYGLTLWCALGLLARGAIQVPQLQLQLQFLRSTVWVCEWRCLCHCFYHCYLIFLSSVHHHNHRHHHHFHYASLYLSFTPDLKLTFSTNRSHHSLPHLIGRISRIFMAITGLNCSSVFVLFFFVYIFFVWFVWQTKLI